MPELDFLVAENVTLTFRGFKKILNPWWLNRRRKIIGGWVEVDRWLQNFCSDKTKSIGESDKAKAVVESDKAKSIGEGDKTKSIGESDKAKAVVVESDKTESVVESDKRKGSK